MRSALSLSCSEVQDFSFLLSCHLLGEGEEEEEGEIETHISLLEISGVIRFRQFSLSVLISVVVMVPIQ